MRIGVLSDIHANIEALQAAYMDAIDCDVDQFWFLGDAVGYGPDPVPAVLWVANFVESDSWVLGNHEAILAGLLTVQEKAEVGKTAEAVAQCHREMLAVDPGAYDFWQCEFNDARIVPRTHVFNGIQHTLTHAGQTNRHLFRYIYAWQIDFYLPPECMWLHQQFEQTGLPQVQWLGHTHVPLLINATPSGDRFEFDIKQIVPDMPYVLDSNLMLINPGSVGQPRDLDRRASYAILDTDVQTVTFRRVEYDWQTTVGKLYELPLSRKIIENLEDRLVNARPTDKTPPDWIAHYRAVGVVE